MLREIATGVSRAATARAKEAIARQVDRHRDRERRQRLPIEGGRICEWVGAGRGQRVTPIDRDTLFLRQHAGVNGKSPDVVKAVWIAFTQYCDSKLDPDGMPLIPCLDDRGNPVWVDREELLPTDEAPMAILGDSSGNVWQIPRALIRWAEWYDLRPDETRLHLYGGHVVMVGPKHKWQEVDSRSCLSQIRGPRP